MTKAELVKYLDGAPLDTLEIAQNLAECSDCLLAREAGRKVILAEEYIEHWFNTNGIERG